MSFLNSDLLKQEDFKIGEKIVVFSEGKFVGTYTVVKEGNDIFAKAEFVMQPLE